jgi:hypothetical protein
MYHADIRLLLGATKTEINEYFQGKYGVSHDSGKADAQTVTIQKDNIFRHYIILLEFDWLISHQAILAHEIFHVVCSVLGDIGMRLCDDSEEAYAYYLQFLHAQILKVLAVKTGAWVKEDKRVGRN